MSWPVATVGEVCEVVSGATPRTGKPEFWDGNVPWVTPKDLSELGQKHLSDTPRKITKAGLKSCSARMLPAQSVLFSSRAPIGLVAINTIPVCTNQGFKSLVPRFDLVSPDFLFWWLKAQEKHVQSKGRGATFKEVSKKIVEDLQIPLPPLAEQKRLAGILDAADALRAKRREALAQLDTLLQSTFLDMFGDPVTNPMGWPPTSLSAISEELRDGPFGSNLKSSHYVESGVRVIRLQNIGVGEIRNDDLAFISEKHFASLPRNHCQPGDVIIGTMGDPNLRACIVPWAMARALNKADCILMRVDMTKVDAIYVCWLLNNPRMVSMALRLVRGQTRGRISLGRLKELQIHLPPIELQHRFAAIVKSVEQQKASQRAHMAELDTLFASLQSRAFRGDL